MVEFGHMENIWIMEGMGGGFKGMLDPVIRPVIFGPKINAPHRAESQNTATLGIQGVAP